MLKKIAMITDSIFISEKQINQLQEELPTKTIKKYASVQSLINDYAENSTLDTVIMDANKNLSKAQDYFSNKDDVKMVVYVPELNRKIVAELFSLHFHGYFMRGMSISELVYGIEVINSGKNYIHPSLRKFIFHFSRINI